MVVTSRTIIIEQGATDEGTLAMVNLRMAAKHVDEEAKELEIEPWLKLDEY